MAFCPSCGSQVEGRFCAKCGTSIGAASEPAGGGAAAAPQQQQYQPPPQQYQPPPQQQYQQQYQQPQYQQPAADAGMSENVASGLCYIFGFITGILFLVIAPYNQNKNIRFHAFQSIFLNVAMVGVMIVLGILGTILGFISSLFSIITLVLFPIIYLAIFVIWLIVMIKAFMGQRFVVPVIGPLAEKQA